MPEGNDERADEPGKEKAAEGSPSPCNHSLSQQQPWDCDVTTIARGPAECNELLRRGWKVFSVSYVDEVRRRSAPGVQETRQVMAYYTLGRRFTWDESEQGKVALQVEAAEAADAASAPPPEPEPPDNPAADPPQPLPSSPPAAPIASRPPRKAGPARPGSTRAPGAMGPVKTEGIRPS